MNTKVTNIGGLDIPSHDHIAIARFAGTNNISTVTYRQGGATGTVVAEISLTYTPNPPVANDAAIAAIVRTI